MRSMPKISIVIAMHNIEKYIATCLESCLNQKNVEPDDYEIVIVNDGSTDNSLSIAEKSIYGATNAKIITRINGGLSEARNTGLQHIIGEYVWFVDGDDTIAENAIYTLIANIDKYRYDAYIINFSTFEIKDKINTSDFNLGFLPKSGKYVHYTNNRILPMMAWLTIYNVGVIKNNNLLFLPGILHEDFEFSVKAHHMCSSIGFIPEDLYYYRISRSDSIMSAIRKDNTRSLLSGLEILQSFKEFFKDEDNQFVRHLYGMCATSFFIRRYDNAFVLNDVTSNLIKENKLSLYDDMWKSKEWKRRLLLLFIIVSPKFMIKKVLYQLGERSKLM